MKIWYFYGRWPRGAPQPILPSVTLCPPKCQILESCFLHLKCEKKMSKYIHRGIKDNLIHTNWLNLWFLRLLTDTEEKLKELTDYWMVLPNHICATGISSPNNTKCWNGKNTDGYVKLYFYKVLLLRRVAKIQSCFFCCILNVQARACFGTHCNLLMNKRTQDTISTH